MMEAFDDGKKAPKKMFCISEYKILEFLKTIIIGKNILGKLLFETCCIQTEQKNTKKNKESFKELIKNHGTDCTRLYAVDSSKNIEEYEQFINKLRNA